MAAVKLLVGAGWLALTTVAWAGTDDRALATLRRALESQRTVHCVLVQSRNLDADGPRLLLKVRLAGDKGMMVTVLQPFSMQGITSIDDAQTLRTYMPDQSTVLYQPSPVRFQPAIAWRLPLIGANYSVEFGQRERVAGRTVRVIELTPRHEPMPTRRLFVDESRDVVLRYEVQTEGERPVRFVDTKSVVYSRAGEDDPLELPESEDRLRRVVNPGPRGMGSGTSARKALGFTPRLPKTLPYGFRVHASHLVGTEGTTHLALRLSDGMVAVTIYQWANGRLKREEPGSREWRRQDRHGVWFAPETVIGDPLPAEVVEGLLDAFRR